MKIQLKALRADVDVEQKEDGTWVKAPDLPGVEFRVRAIHFKPYTVAREAMFRAMRKEHGAAAHWPEDELNARLGKLYAEHLLLEWRGFDEPYTRERALEVLTDPGYRIMRDAVTGAAGTVGAGSVEFVEDAAKN